MAKIKKPTESVQGRYTAVPHSLLDCVAFMGASHMARSLLCELMRQHDGRNNGHLHLSEKWLRERGWRSKDGIRKSKLELLGRGLIVKTREGGLNAGPDRYGLTWLAITNFVGLDIQQKGYQPGAYQLMGPFVQAGKAPPPVARTSPAHAVKQKCPPAHRGSATPHTGVVSESTTPHTGAREGHFQPFTTPHTGDNVLVTTVPAAVAAAVDVVADAVGLPNPKRIAGKPRKRIVGKACKSGKPKNSHATASETAHPAQHINASAYASLRAVDLGAGMSWATL